MSGGNPDTLELLIRKDIAGHFDSRLTDALRFLEAELLEPERDRDFLLGAALEQRALDRPERVVRDVDVREELVEEVYPGIGEQHRVRLHRQLQRTWVGTQDDEQVTHAARPDEQRLTAVQDDAQRAAAAGSEEPGQRLRAQPVLVRVRLALLVTVMAVDVAGGSGQLEHDRQRIRRRRQLQFHTTILFNGIGK